MELMEYILAGFVALTALIILFPVHVVAIAILLYSLGRHSKK